MVFGEVAELYDKVRAGYPQALIDEVLAFAGSHPRAVEVGAGTGRATVAFADRGLEILALEPNPAMAAVGMRNCRRFPNVRMRVSRFEDWPVERKRFGLLYSAQAWHWVSPQIRYEKATEALTLGGTLALFWHRTSWSDEALRAELDQLYRRLAPELHAREPGFPGLAPPKGDDELLAEISASGRFTHVTTRTYAWSASFTADTFTDLLVTQSDHRLLPGEERTTLLDAVRQLISDRWKPSRGPPRTFLVLARSG
jgi:SAM-dependent methyltransferase